MDDSTKEVLDLVTSEPRPRYPRPNGVALEPGQIDKACSMCGITKQLEEFYKQTVNGYTYYRPECKLCNNEKGKDWCSKNKEHQKATALAYYKANLKSFDYWRAKSTAKKRGATLFMSVEEWEVLRQGRNCSWCNLLLEPSFTNLDHVIPLCEGGQHTIENVVLSCANCNLQREWLRKVKHISTNI